MASADQNSKDHDGHKRLEWITARLDGGERIEPVTVRELLRWFGAEYRGRRINDNIREALFINDLRIEPGLNEIRIEDSVEFRRGVVIDEIDEKFFATPREFHAGKRMDEIEAAWANKLYVDHISDCLAGWIDRNPRATKAEIQARAEALNKLNFDELERADSAEIIPFPNAMVRIGRSPSSGHVTTDALLDIGTSQCLNIFYVRREPAIQKKITERKERLFFVLGRFIYEFSQLEFLIRRALAKVLELGDDRLHAVISPYDFAALCRVTERLCQTIPGTTVAEREELKELFGACLKVNDDRNRIVHGTWYLDDKGLGAEHVSRQSLKPKIHYEQIEEIVRINDRVERLREQLEKFLMRTLHSSSEPLA